MKLPKLQVRRPLMQQCANQNSFKKSANSVRERRGSRALGSSGHLLNLTALLSTASDVSRHKSRHKRPSSAGKENNPLTINALPSTNLKHVIVHIPLAPQKFKLQLFPLDERVRTGLEKDGHNPHLELTMSAKKRISSVLQHMNNKWGQSSVALGELTLFPFNTVPENLVDSQRKWTMDDKGVSAGDVHTAIGCPAIFRLRYSWFPVRSNDSEVEASFTPELSGQESDTLMEESDAALGTCIDDNWAEMIDEELDQGDLNVIMELISEPDLCNFKEEHPVNSNSIPQSENDITVEDLLSETSHLEDSSSPDEKSSNDDEPAFCPSPLVVSDSFDAFMKDFVPPPESRDPTGTESIIMDPENACHPFTVDEEVPSSSGQQVDGASSEVPCEGQSTLDAEAKSDNNLPCAVEVNDDQESKIAALQHELLHEEEEDSPELSNINWTDSMDPWELSTQHMTKEEIASNLEKLVW